MNLTGSGVLSTLKLGQPLVGGCSFYNSNIAHNLLTININLNNGLRKFIFGLNGAEFTHDALITYQAMTCGFNIHYFSIQNKP